MISQFCEESKPERIVLIHVENSWNTKSFHVLLRMDLMACNQNNVHFYKRKGLAHHLLSLFQDRSQRASEINGCPPLNLLMVRRQLSWYSRYICHWGCIGKFIDFINGKHGCIFTFFETIAFSCNQCALKQLWFCNIRTDCLTSGDGLKASEYGIIVECTTCTTILPSSDVSDTLITLKRAFLITE